MTPAEPENNGKDGRDMLYETIAFPDNAPLQCSIVEVEEYPFHMHDDVLEIMFALEGSFELTVVNNVLDMKAGDIYVSCPRELHRLCAYPHTRGTVMLLHINVEAYRAEFPDLRTYQFANSALENNTAGIQMLGSYLKKQLPRLLDRTGTETAAYREVGEKILDVYKRQVLTSVSLPSKAPSAAMGMQSKPRMAGKLVTDSEYRSGKAEAEASAPSHRTALA